jgi:hypothetical protein
MLKAHYRQRVMVREGMETYQKNTGAKKVERFHAFT